MTENTRLIANDLSRLGLKEGDTVLVHSSLKSLGGASPEEVIKGLLSVLGEEGTLVFPALSYIHCNPSKPNFDYYNTPSNVGALPEFFRTSVKGVVRSLCPTHSCCAIGKNAEYIVSGHILDKTPCGENSPFRRLMQLGGKILFIGCGMRPNTSMHAVEELSCPDYLFGDDASYIIKDSEGKEHKTVCRAHGFKGVIQCYERLATLLDENELKIGKVMSAECHLVSAPAMWLKADQKYREEPHYFIDWAG
ncbi:MAG: AAC(3) family N-acetyltransferase [Clostridia bacterium]|nr:AAC(3) family N-acetyltransferase [Clostridia bacterium]